MVIKSPDEWATTKQACRDELVVYWFFSHIYFALLLCIEHCFAKISFHTLYLYMYVYMYGQYIYPYVFSIYIDMY